MVALRQLQPQRVDGGEALAATRALGCLATRTCTAATPGGQAEYVRVPFADVGPIKVPDALTDEQVLFLSDIFPTGYMAAENCNIRRGDTVAVWGCGPVGQFAIRSAYLLGAERVIAIDRFPERLAPGARRPARRKSELRPQSDVLDELRAMTGGRGPDACIDAVGLEAHGTTLDACTTGPRRRCISRPTGSHALRQAITACRKGGIVSIPGVYGGWLDKFPLGAAFAKGLTLQMGQTHVHRYMRPLLERVERGDIDPSFVITHRVALDDAPRMYKTFREKEDSCIKVVMKPALEAAPPSLALALRLAIAARAAARFARRPLIWTRARWPPPGVLLQAHASGCDRGLYSYSQASIGARAPPVDVAVGTCVSGKGMTRDGARLGCAGPQAQQMPWLQRAADAQRRRTPTLGQAASRRSTCIRHATRHPRTLPLTGNPARSADHVDDRR